MELSISLPLTTFTPNEWGGKKKKKKKKKTVHFQEHKYTKINTKQKHKKY